jgi:hypothetical protein
MRDRYRCEVSEEKKAEPFADLTFDDFREMAADPSLSMYEKIGFPDSYRDGFEDAIFDDIVRKLPRLHETSRVVLDIGPGCSDLPSMLVELCARQGHELIQVDSREMLSHFDGQAGVRQFVGRFPEVPDLLDEYRGRVDVALAYSVLHYVFPEHSVFSFVDRLMELLAAGGSALVGDVPNASKRRRFFASGAGRAFHRQFTGRDEDPEVVFNTVTPDSIDDVVLAALAARAHSSGLDAYVLPQGEALPMANRRDDLLIRRP